MRSNYLRSDSKVSENSKVIQVINNDSNHAGRFGFIWKGRHKNKDNQEVIEVIFMNQEKDTFNQNEVKILNGTYIDAWKNIPKLQMAWKDKINYEKIN